VDTAMSVGADTFPVELAVFDLVGRGGFESERIPDEVFCEIAPAGFDEDSVARDCFLEFPPSNCGTDVWLGLEARFAGFAGFGGGAFFDGEAAVAVEDTLPVLPAVRIGRGGGGVAALDLIPFPAGWLPSQAGTVMALRGGGGSGFGLPLPLLFPS
jgi:hypothetical protein